MVNIDQLKYDYYNEVATYIASLFNGFRISKDNDSFRLYEDSGKHYYYFIRLNCFSFCLLIDQLIGKKFHFKCRKQVELLYEKPQVRDILLTLLPH